VNHRVENLRVLAVIWLDHKRFRVLVLHLSQFLVELFHDLALLVDGLCVGDLTVVFRQQGQQINHFDGHIVGRALLLGPSLRHHLITCLLLIKALVSSGTLLRMRYLRIKQLVLVRAGLLHQLFEHLLEFFVLDWSKSTTITQNRVDVVADHGVQALQDRVCKVTKILVLDRQGLLDGFEELL